MAAAAHILESDPSWRGWEYYLVTTTGGHDPSRVASTWTAQEVHDAYWDLCLAGVLG